MSNKAEDVFPENLLSSDTDVKAFLMLYRRLGYEPYCEKYGEELFTIIIDNFNLDYKHDGRFSGCTDIKFNLEGKFIKQYFIDG